MLRDFRIHLTVARIIGKVKLKLAVRINAGVGKAQRQGAGRTAFVQPDFPPRRPVDRRLGLIISNKTANILHDNDGSRHWRRRKITQYSPLPIFDPDPGLRAALTFKLGSRSEPAVNKSWRICDLSGYNKRRPQLSARVCSRMWRDFDRGPQAIDSGKACAAFECLRGA